MQLRPMLFALRCTAGWLVLAPPVMIPFPEIILGAHGWIRGHLGISLPFIFFLALAVSLLQMAGEYALLGRAGHQMTDLGFAAWWRQSYLRKQLERSKKALRLDLISFTDRMSPALTNGGYLAMFICSANPLSVFTPPVVRLTGVLIWRTARLPGSALLLSLGTALRLAIVFAGILGAQHALR